MTTVAINMGGTRRVWEFHSEWAAYDFIRICRGQSMDELSKWVWRWSNEQTT